MSPTPPTKPPFQAIKDHSDLMDAFVSLTRAVVQQKIYCWNNDEEIRILKSEIAHFLRIQSAQPGVAANDSNSPFDKSNAVPDNDVRKHSNNPNL